MNCYFVFFFICRNADQNLPAPALQFSVGLPQIRGIRLRVYDIFPVTATGFFKNIVSGCFCGFCQSTTASFSVTFLIVF
jgi:hypothetical protein